MTYSLGVDLGTSFVAAAVARPAGVAMVPLGDQSVVAPAVVSVRPDGSIVAGDAAERRAISQPTLVARSVKRRLGDPDPVRLGDVSYPVATLLSAQLRDVVQKAAEREGGPPEQVVLAHPATWTPARRARFEEVARAAGIDAPRLVTAAEAAAHYAARGGTSDGRIVAVYDLGGGGFEATIVRTGPGGPEILGTPEGVEGFGGADIDEAILSYVDDAVGGALARLDMRRRADGRRAGPAAPGLRAGQGEPVAGHGDRRPRLPSRPALRDPAEPHDLRADAAFPPRGDGRRPVACGPVRRADPCGRRRRCCSWAARHASRWSPRP